jgi:menaquinone-dependent protoporphyrinogen oxidase
MDVLVVYATKHGSTRQVAEVIAEGLRAQGASVRIRPAAVVWDSVAGEDLVVLGGALYSGRWHRDARRFLRRHRHELAGVPVAVFGMGPRSDDESAWRRSHDQLDRALAKRPWLHPVAIAVFGGVDPPHGADHPQRDLRDWDAIRDWARLALSLSRVSSGQSRTG